MERAKHEAVSKKFLLVDIIVMAFVIGFEGFLNYIYV